MKVKKGIYKTVYVYDTNGFNELLESFFKCGWAMKTDIQGNTKRYLTFESGEDATMPMIDTPKATIL